MIPVKKTGMRSAGVPPPAVSCIVAAENFSATVRFVRHRLTANEVRTIQANLTYAAAKAVAARR